MLSGFGFPRDLKALRVMRVMRDVRYMASGRIGRESRGCGVQA